MKFDLLVWFLIVLAIALVGMVLHDVNAEGFSWIKEGVPLLVLALIAAVGAVVHGLRLGKKSNPNA